MRVSLLHAVDTAWMAHLDAMDDLRDGVGLSSYAQRNPITEYRIASSEMFDEMIEKIREDTVRFILFTRPAQEIKRTAVAKQQFASLRNVGGKGEKKQPLIKKAAEEWEETIRVRAAAGKSTRTAAEKIRARLNKRAKEKSIWVSAGCFSDISLCLRQAIPALILFPTR